MVITFYTPNENITERVTRLVHGPIKPQADEEMTRNNQTMSEDRSADIRVRLGPRG